MLRYLTQRLAAGALILALVNFVGFAYAHGARYIQQLQNPYGTRAAPPEILPLYAEYLQAATRLDFGTLAVGVGVPVMEALGQAALASAGLLALAAVFSVLTGLALGLLAVRVEPPGVARWLTPVVSLGLAMPSFYLGTLFVAAAAFLLLRGLGEFPLPLGGFGWDAHLALPTLALVIRPATQIAQVTANLLADEIRKQYVVTARSFGNTWRRIRWRHALSNALAPILLTVAGAFRLAVGELVLVEWLFAWPGLGRLLAQTLLAPNIAAPGSLSGGGQYFLHPPLLAALLMVLALAFITVETAASSLARAVDPRLRLDDPQH